MLSFKPSFDFYAHDASLIRFDSDYELTWVGDTQGCLKSYSDGLLYTSTAVSQQGIVDMHMKNSIIYGIGPSTLKGINSRGVPCLFKNNFDNLTCLTSSKEYLHIGGDVVTDIDVVTNDIVYTRHYQTNRLKSHQDFLLASDASQLYLLDFKSDECLNISASNGIITNIETFGNYVLTTSSSFISNCFQPDSFFKLYDIRSLKLVKAIPFSSGAAHLLPHPRANSVFIVGSLNGSLLMHDIINSNSNIYKLTDQITSDITISTSGDVIGTLDNYNSISLFSSSEYASINTTSEPLQYATYIASYDYKPTRPPEGYFSEDMSMFTNNKCIPPPIDPALLKAATFKDGVGYVPNTNQITRNLFQSFEVVDKKEIIVFHSQKSKKTNTSTISSIAEVKGLIPDHYMRHDIKYSKFGVEDFDFSIFNKTRFPGLENHIKNCYLNSLLFLYYFIPDFNNFCCNHINSNCNLINCFSCELGFLFKMMNTAQGVNCQARNFLMAFTNNPKSKLLNLSEPSHLYTPIQHANTFILEQIVKETTNIEKHLFENHFGIKYEINKSCQICHHTSPSTFIQYAINLNYCDTIEATFQDHLKHTFCNMKTMKSNCKNCGKSTLHTVHKQAIKYPNVLLINLNASLAQKKLYWSNSKDFQFFKDTFIPVQITINDSAYNLQGNVSFIDVNGHKEHLVTQLFDPADDNWMVFNDFQVVPIQQHEVIENPKEWKTPCVLMYRKRDYKELKVNTLDSGDLTQFLQQNQSSSSPILSPSVPSLVPLQSYELTKKGFLCALDAEFVSLQEEEVEFKSDGSRTIKKPTRLHLARVSILRGDGLHEGKPFIDDYIIPKEEILDYLTPYSGIKPDDLDPKTSRKRLLHLKTVYKKIRYLIDAGCIFVGHGLKNDLRIIST